MKHFLILLIFVSCSKSISTSKKETVPVNTSQILIDGKYITLSENTTPVYASREVRMGEVEGNTFYYTVGLLNDYAIDQDGNPRPGNHPPREFRMQNAAYRIIKEGNLIRLEFMQSSCRNPAINPFIDIIPSSAVSIEQLNDQLKIISNETEILYKEEQVVSDIWSQGNVKRILCDGETNE